MVVLGHGIHLLACEVKQRWVKKKERLTGKVLGEIVDGFAKAAYLERSCELIHCHKTNSITMGDGSNNLLMMQGSGISIAYKAKPIVKEKADAAFDRVGLDAALLLIA